MKYLYRKSEMTEVEKHKINLLVPDMDTPGVNVVQVRTERGHFQEFRMKDITFIYTIVDGKGVFFVDKKPLKVGAGDMIVLPPDHRLWYAGKLKMVLASVPAYDQQKEEHIRFVSEEEMEKSWRDYLSD